MLLHDDRDAAHFGQKEEGVFTGSSSPSSIPPSLHDVVVVVVVVQI